MNDLYRLFSRGVRFYICRHLGPNDIDDKVHDTFIVVMEALQRGELRDVDRLMPFVRTVVRRVIATHINRAIQLRRESAEFNSDMATDRHPTPEEDAIRRENEENRHPALHRCTLRGATDPEFHGGTVSGALDGPCSEVA